MSSKTEFVTRAITFPASHVIAGGTWQEFMKLLHQLWRDSTAASNYAVRYYALNDNALDGDRTKVGRSYLYAYPLLTERFPAISTGTCSAISMATLKAYNNYRAAFWRGDRAMPLYRYPAPYPIRAQDWSAKDMEDGRMAICFSTGRRVSTPETPNTVAAWEAKVAAYRGWKDKKPSRSRGGASPARQPNESPEPVCPVCGKKRRVKGMTHWIVALSGGPGFARQRQTFIDIVRGDVKARDIAIYRSACGFTNRSGTSEKTPGGASRVSYRVMIKIVVDMPVRPQCDSTGVMNLMTDREALWVAEHQGRAVKPWILNADEAVHWLARMKDAHLDHKAKLQRMSEDFKLERRTHVGRREQLLGKMEQMCRKHRNRLRTFVQQCAAGIANYCERRKICAVIYDDTERGWLTSFPWFALKAALKSCLDGKGIDHNIDEEGDIDEASAGLIESPSVVETSATSNGHNSCGHNSGI